MRPCPDQDPRKYHLADPLWSPGSTGKQWLPVPDSPTNRDPTGLVKEEAANKRIVESLIRWMEGGDEPPVSIREGRATLEMILAVYAAHLKGCRVSFPLAERKHPLV